MFRLVGRIILLVVALWAVLPVSAQNTDPLVWSGVLNGVNPQNPLAFNADGSLIAAVVRGNEVRRFDTEIGYNPVGDNGRDNSRRILALAFAVDGHVVVADQLTNGTLLVWKTEQDPGFDQTLNAVRYQVAAFDQSGMVVAVVNLINPVYVWSANTGRIIGEFGTADQLFFNVAVSGDASQVAAAGFNNTIQVWALSSGQDLGTTPAFENGIEIMRLSSDGSLLATYGPSADEVALWTVVEGEAPALVGTLARSGVKDIAFSPDGSLIAFGDSEGTVTLWDTVTLKQRVSIPAHAGWVVAVAFSPDGSRLATVGLDDTLNLWNVSLLLES